MAEPLFRFVGLDVAEGAQAVVRFQILDESGEQVGVYPVGIGGADDARVGAIVAQAHRNMSAIMKLWAGKLEATALTFDQR